MARLANRVRSLPGGALAFGFTAFVLTLMTWPVTSLEPGIGLDPSWVTALHMAAYEGLNFGPDAVYSFGPLGFLRIPSYAYPWTTRLSFAYIFVTQLALCLALLWVLRRNFGSLLVAAPITLVIATLVYAEPVPVLVFAIVVGLVREEFPQRLVPAILAGTGALVAVQLMAKLNTGVAVAALSAIALIAATGRARRVRATWFGAGLAVTLIAGWTLSGQSLTAIPDYLRGSLEVISGYSESMGLGTPGSQWEYWEALVLVAIGVVITLRGDPGAPARVKLAMAAMWLVLSFTAFKSGFVRHEVNHANLFFGAMLGGLVALPLARLPRSTSVLVLLLASTALLASFRVDPTDLIDPLGRPDTFAGQLRTLTDGSDTSREIARAREVVAAAYGVDPKIVAALRGHSVHVEPYDTNVLWAYQLRWKPVPAFQTYVAYTSDLDERNAAAFASPGGPERVLRRDVAPVDGRNAAWESPAAIRAMFCHFRAVVTVAPWQVLERTADRCGPPRLIDETRARFGKPIAVPPAPDDHSLVYVELEGVAVGGLERIRATAFRAQERSVTIGGRSVRLVPGTAQDGLILRVAPVLDYPAPLALDQGSAELTVTRGAGDQPDGEIRARFYAVALR